MVAFNYLFILSLLSLPINYLIPHLYTKNSNALISSIIISILAYFTTIYLIPLVKEMNLKAELRGRDLNKGKEGQNTFM
jgi:hypothetical protein